MCRPHSHTTAPANTTPGTPNTTALRSAGPSTRDAYASRKPAARTSQYPDTAPATSTTAASSRNAFGFGRGAATATAAGGATGTASRRRSRRARTTTRTRDDEPGAAALATGAAPASSSSSSPNRSGSSIPPANPSTCGPAPYPLGPSRHQSGSPPSPSSPSSSSPARCGGTFSAGRGSGARLRRTPRCSGTDGTGGTGDTDGTSGEADTPAAPASTSSGVPIRSRILRTAAGVSGSYLARRRSISSRSPATSRIRSPDDSCLRCAKSPTLLRYS
ncbi:hypothetical protein [Streptomyces cirratus]|uniref:hypothetical protein n=1 Tax=Streptomyces cirratus TaxID=68187 RepID=UPI003613BE74